MDASYKEFPCDLCNSNDSVEAPYTKLYTGQQPPVHICRACGFVYVKSRRSAKAIADAWSHDIFGGHYDARIPAVIARQTYVAEFIDVNLGIKGKKVLDIGAGEGQFLDLIQKRYGAQGFGIEPSAKNCERLTQLGIRNFNGSVEDFNQSTLSQDFKVDLTTIMWTLENCLSCNEMLATANRALSEGGHLIVATGSRLLVPFKKALQDYLPANAPTDTHCFRFSANTLRGLLAKSGFKTVHINRYVDSDILCVIAQKQPAGTKIDWQGDNYLKVHDFFERWHKESVHY